MRKGFNFADIKQQKDDMEGMTTYTLNVPTNKARLLRALVKELGGTMAKTRATKKRCGLDEALDDIKAGRITTYASVESFFKEMGI